MDPYVLDRLMATMQKNLTTSDNMTTVITEYAKRGHDKMFDIEVFNHKTNIEGFRKMRQGVQRMNDVSLEHYTNIASLFQNSHVRMDGSTFRVFF